MSVELGQWGEDTAVRYLEAKHYEILERNWRYSRAEVDIIARIDGQLIFVEVKYRKNSYFGKPEAFVDRRKQFLLAEVAAVYCERTDYDGEIRFDIVSITGSPDDTHRIRHIEDAFFPAF